MNNLSGRQLAILEFIKQEVRSKGYPPSVREIGEAVGLKSSSTVHGHLDRLEKRGAIRRDPTKPRAIEVLYGNDNDENMFDFDIAKIPLVGSVTAGAPILATENIEEYFPLPARFIGQQNVFMLQIIGDSMIEAGIHDGDFVIVQQQEIASNGEIVVAMTADDEATVKRFYKEKERYRLQPENASMDPIYLDHVSILGKVIGLFRNIK